MLQKVFLGVWYAVVMILLLLALAASLMRAYPNFYQKYLPAIQSNITEILGKPVRADSIRIDWHDFAPLVSIKNLSIYEDDSEYDLLMNVDEAAISIDIYKSLLQKKIAFKELTFIEANLELERISDEKIILNGIDISHQLSMRDKSTLDNKFKINLLDSTISIIDEVKKLNYFFDQVDVVLGIHGRRFNVTSNFILPETLGESFSMVADIRDLDKGWKNIKGDLYAKGNRINLELLSDFFPKLRVGIKRGFSDFEIWGDFDSVKQSTLAGHLFLRDLIYKDNQISHPSDKDNKKITSLKTKFRLFSDINEWNIRLDDVDIHASDYQWPAAQYELSCENCEQDKFIINTAIGYLHIDQLLSTIQHFPFITEKIVSYLDQVSVQGELRETNFLTLINNKKIEKYSYHAVMQDLDIHIPNQEISVSSISGSIEGNHTHGEVKLATDNSNIDFRKILNNPLENQSITGSLSWSYDDKNLLLALEDLNVRSNEMQANLQGLVHLQEDKPYIDIQAQVAEANAETIMHYLPYKRMHPKLVKWLSEAIIDGYLKNGSFLFHGNPKNFPFKNKPGRFQIYADVQGGTLNYRNDWPHVDDIDASFEINNNSLVVNAKQANILDSKVQYATAEINDLKLPRLIINGRAEGPANNIFQYLQQSSLLPEDSQLIKHLTASGNTGLELDLIITLTKKLVKELHVGGEIQFNNTSLKVNPISMPFTDMQGKLQFDLEGAKGENLTARLFGIPVSASAERLGAGRTQISIEGDLDLDAYLASNFKNLESYLHGIAPFSAKIKIPKLDKKSDDKTLRVEAKSNLYGVKISIPEPFQKDFRQTKQLSIHTKHAKNVESEIYASLNNQVFMQAMLDHHKIKPSRMEVRLGNEQFVLPEKGIKISGRMKSLDLGQWLALPNQDDKKNIELSEIDLTINQVALNSIDFTNVDFKMRRELDFWSGNIDSSIAKGKFDYPVDAKSGSVATADFDYLRFGPMSNNSDSRSTNNFDPRSLPALVVSAKSFQYQDAVFSDVTLKTKPSQNGLTIDSLQGRGNDLNVSANGLWEALDNNTQVTNLNITLKTDNIQNSLNGLGFESAVTGGDGRLTAKFSWPKAPYQFSLPALEGNANLRLNEGMISSVEPGAGRIIGLVNLSEITRRLSLDFRDFFSKGYAFEKIRGDLRFKDANLKTENLKVRGPSADILIQGRTGIKTQDYDQTVTVTPHVSGGLPWIGLAVGGPIGAVGVAVAEKIAKSIGMDVDKVTQVQYSMKGSWDEPVIEPISQKFASKKKQATQGQPSPKPQ